MLRSLFLIVCLSLVGCGDRSTPSIRLALDGPPLYVALQSDSAHWSGLMDRGCMAGLGQITLRDGNGIICNGKMDHPANDKGRLYAELSCANGNTVTLVFRNLGPDQGMGLARVNPETPDGEQLALFYHPSQDEARRRLEQVRAEIAAARESKNEETQQTQ